MFERSTFGVVHVVRPPSVGLASNLNGWGFRYSSNIMFRTSAGSAMKLVVGGGAVRSVCLFVTGSSSVVCLLLSDAAVVAVGDVGLERAIVNNVTTSIM